MLALILERSNDWRVSSAVNGLEKFILNSVFGLSVMKEEIVAKKFFFLC